MMDAKYAPVFLLRSYIWAVLSHPDNGLGMTTANYGGVIPVVPVSEEPELTQYDKPYIVYGYANNPAGEGLHFRKRGSMSMVVYSTSFSEIVKILTVLEHALGREDDTARDINNYTSKTPAFVGLNFGTVSIGFLEGPSPEEVEGGRQSGLINIRYEYYVDYNVKTNV